MLHETAINLEFGANTCTGLLSSGRREWLITNGIGGYGMGTLCGIPARGYHGLLVAALQPPVRRTLLLAKLDETVTYDGSPYCLFANHWANGLIEPRGFERVVNFRLDGTTPVWTYVCADALVEKRLWMQQGANTTYVSYHLARASLPMTFSIKVLITYRDHHRNGRANNLPVQVDKVPHGLRFQMTEGATPLRLLCPDAEMTPRHEWYRDYYLASEAQRGIDAHESYLHAATVEFTLRPGVSITLVAGTDTEPTLDGGAAYEERRSYERSLINRARPNLHESSALLEHLVLAADQFIVSRPQPGEPEGRSVIAGYPWFTDWGRDTMISLPGLTLATGRYDVARSILNTFSRYVDKGMLPNRFPDAGEAPEYNTVDATLWYIEAVRAYYRVTSDCSLLDHLFPVLEDIIQWHIRGTRYQIHMDAEDSLIYAGEPGIQLTWMDAKVGDWVVTPRIGKPVEINALWYNALRTMAWFAQTLGTSDRGMDYNALADKVQASFGRFWHTEKDYCYDVIDGPGEVDDSLRPNQLFAVSLHYSPLTPERQKAVVDACARKLLTPYGLRSLSPDHPDYKGHYGGNQRERDAAYHQGIVWGWLIGPFVSAHLRVYQDPDIARSFLTSMLYQLSDHGVGNLSEIFEGDAPFEPRGCIAQAWTVAEVLRTWEEIDKFQPDKTQ